MVLALALALLSSDNLVKNGDFRSGMEHWYRAGTIPASPTVVQVGGQSAVHLSFDVTPGANSWDVELKQDLSMALPRGKSLEFSMRAKGTPGSRVGVRVQLGRDPWTVIASGDWTLSNDWQSFRVIGRTTFDYRPGDAQVALQFAYASGTVEVTDVRLVEVAGSNASLENPVPLVRQTGSTDWGFVGDEIGLSQDDESIRVKFNPAPGGPPYAVNLRTKATGSILPGDTIVAKFRARAKEPVRIAQIFELDSPPHTKVMSNVTTVGTDWKDYLFASTAGRSFDAGEAALVFYLGYAPGEVEFRDIEVTNVGSTPLSQFKQTVDYYGSAPNPGTWRPAAEERIERYRKGDLTVNVMDANGRPIPNAVVKAEMTRHEFRFGTAGPAARIVAEDEDSQKYRATLQRLFNTFTFENDLKWPQNLSEENNARADRAIAWLRSQNFDIRGHVLVWGSQQNMPSGLMALDKDALWARVEDRIRTAATHYKGKLYCWDVVNEAVTERELWDKVGWEKMAEAFRLTRNIDPGVKLAYNDYNITEEATAGQGHKQQAIEIVKRLIADGAPIDVFGVQGHVGVPITPTARVIEILQEVAALGLKVEVTEYDLGVHDDEVHAQHMAEFLTACFSVPEVEAFIMWGFWEAQHWRAHEGGAMFRRDWTERPAVKAYEDLVKGKWWSRESGRTDADGSATFRVFGGDYRVEVEVNGARRTIPVKVPARGSSRLDVRIPG